MVEIGQTSADGGRTMRLLVPDVSPVRVRDAYGWRRPLTAGEGRTGCRVIADHVDRVRRLMAQRATAPR